MNTPILFYREGTCALGSMIALEALNEPYRLVRLEHGENDGENYLRINPLGEVPTLINSNGVLTESLAILQHIGSNAIEHGLSFPQRTAKFDRLNQILAYLVTSYHKAYAPIFGAKAFHPDPQIQSEVKRTVTEGNLRDQLRYINDYLLSDHHYFFENFTVADAYFYATGRWAKNFFDIGKDFPNIARFFESMEREEVVRSAVAIEEGRVKDAKGAFQGHVSLESLMSENEPLFPGIRRATPQSVASETTKPVSGISRM